MNPTVLKYYFSCSVTKSNGASQSVLSSLLWLTYLCISSFLMFSLLWLVIAFSSDIPPTSLPTHESFSPFTLSSSLHLHHHRLSSHVLLLEIPFPKLSITTYRSYNMKTFKSVTNFYLALIVAMRCVRR